MSQKKDDQNEKLTEEQAEQVSGGRTQDCHWPPRYKVDEVADADLNEVAGGRTQEGAWPARMKVDDSKES